MKTGRRSSRPGPNAASVLKDAPSAFGPDVGHAKDLLNGGRLILLNTNTSTRNSHITRAILDDARALFGSDVVRLGTYANLVQLARDSPGATAIALDGQNAQLDVLQAARQYLSRLALWSFDDPYNLTENVAASAVFDHVFTNDPASVEAYGLNAACPRASHLPLAAPSRLLSLESRPAADRPFDLFFCGSAWPNRVALLNRLLKDLPDCDAKFFLVYNPHLPGMKLQQPESAYLKALAFDDMIEMARRSKVSLGLHRSFVGSDVRSHSAEASFPGPRLFELAAAGAYQLVDERDGLRDAFPKADTIHGFRNYKDLLAKLSRALQDAPARDAGIERARKAIASSGTYQHRLVEALTRLPSASTRSPLSMPAKHAAPTKAKRHRLLFVVHSTLTEAAFGGLELHQDIVARHLKDRFDIRFLWSRRKAAGLPREVVLMDPDYKEIGVWPTSQDKTETLLHDPLYETAFARILKADAVDLVHFFHFRECPPSLTDIARTLGVPYTVSLHDYYTIMRNLTLSDGDGRYIGDAVFDLAEVDRLIRKANPNCEPGGAHRRHAAFARALSGSASVIHISHAARQIFERAFPALADHPDIHVHHAPMPSPNWRFFRSQAPRYRAPGAPRYAVLGNFAAHKGGSYLVRALQNLPDFEGELHFHGSIDANIRKAVTSALKGSKSGHAVFHGRYQPGSLDVTAYDASLHLSTWPEVYCQTLSEAWAMRVVPIVTDIGALGERVTHGKNGLKVDPNRPSQLAAIFRQIAALPSLLDPLRDGIDDTLFMDQKPAADQYADVFAATIARQPSSLTKGALSGDPVASILTSAALGRQHYPLHWSSSKGTGLGSEPCRPDHLTNAVEIPRASVTVTPELDGHLERILRDGSPLSFDPDLFINDALFVQGWVRRDKTPDLADLPIWLAIQDEADHATVALFEASSETRPDVAEKFSEAALQWGVVAPFQLLTAHRLLTGRLTLRLGVFDREETKFFALTPTLSARVVHGNRPRVQP